MRGVSAFACNIRKLAMELWRDRRLMNYMAAPYFLINYNVWIYCC